MRQERHDIGAGHPERAGEERRGALPVDIVVAVDHDAAAGPHRGGNDLDRLRHAGKGVGIGQVGQ